MDPAEGAVCGARIPEGGRQMTGSERRDAIIKQIRESRTPVPGKSLAAKPRIYHQ